MSPLTDIAITFSRLSLLAIGGASSVLGEIQRHFVGNGTLSDAELLRLFAVAQAAPGPNAIVVGLIGFHAAGFCGAWVATGAMCGPSGILSLCCARMLERFRSSPWRARLREGFGPVTAGLLLGSGLSLERAHAGAPALVAIAAASAGLGMVRRLNPLLVLLAAALLGIAFA